MWWRMTENKRFKIRLADIWELIDYETKTILSVNNRANELIPVCDLLNTLHEENEQLRKDREDLFYCERDTKNEWRELKQENQELNHFLKKETDLEIEYKKIVKEILQEYFDKYTDICDKLNALHKENRAYVLEIKKLHKENKLLNETIENIQEELCKYMNKWVDLWLIRRNTNDW